MFWTQPENIGGVEAPPLFMPVLDYWSIPGSVGMDL